MPDMIPVLSASALSMSSREIAELTSKAHHHVLRDIRAMVAQLHDVPDDPTLDYLSIHGVTVDRDPHTKRQSCINLDKDHTLTLLTGYDAKARFKVVQRWQQLEAQAAPALPTYAESLRMLADEVERREQAEQQLAIAAPKLAFVDQITRDTDILVDFDQAFSLLKRKTGQTFTRATFLAFLRRYGIAQKPNIYKNIGQRRFVPCQRYVGSWFEAELTPAGTEWKIRPIAISEIVRMIEKERTSTAMVTAYLPHEVQPA